MSIADSDEQANRADLRWANPAVTIEAMRQLSGTAFLEHARDRHLPLDPLASAMGIEIVAVEPRAVTLRCTVQPWQVNLGSGPHGGFLSAMMDQATGWVFLTALAPGLLAPHLSVSYRFLRAGTVGDTLLCRAEIIHIGRTFGAARCELHGGDGRLIATGESTNAITRNFHRDREAGS